MHACVPLHFSTTFPIWGQKETRLERVGRGRGGVVWCGGEGPEASREVHSL